VVTEQLNEKFQNLPQKDDSSEKPDQRKFPHSATIRYILLYLTQTTSAQLSFR